MDIHLNDISQTIQLAIAPVFLLTGVGTTLAVMTNRLARIIDRSRVLEDRMQAAGSLDMPDARSELETLYIRARLINRAITLATSCALLICVVIATLFISAALGLGLAVVIAPMFVLAMGALICSFVYFMREIFVATRSLSIRRIPERKQAKR